MNLQLRPAGGDPFPQNVRKPFWYYLKIGILRQPL